MIFLTGSELSLVTQGFLPGDSLQKRMDLLNAPERLRAHLPEIPARMNAFLAGAVTAVRTRFSGKISYVSLPFEGVDWTPFDMIATDAGYHSRDNADRFRMDTRAFVELGRRLDKPVAISEFGCAAHRGATDNAARAWDVVQYDGVIPVRLSGDFVRDEEVQDRDLCELLDVFRVEGLDAAFVCTFARYDLPQRVGSRRDLATSG